MSEPCRLLCSVWSSVSTWLQRVTESDIRRSCRFILISKRTTMIQQTADKSKLNAENKVLWSRFCPFLCFSFSLWVFIAKIEHQSLRTSEDIDVNEKGRIVHKHSISFGQDVEVKRDIVEPELSTQWRTGSFLSFCKGEQLGQEINWNSFTRTCTAGVEGHLLELVVQRALRPSQHVLGTMRVSSLVRKIVLWHAWPSRSFVFLSGSSSIFN